MLIFFRCYLFTINIPLVDQTLPSFPNTKKVCIFQRIASIYTVIPLKDSVTFSEVGVNIILRLYFHFRVPRQFQFTENLLR